MIPILADTFFEAARVAAHMTGRVPWADHGHLVEREKQQRHPPSRPARDSERPGDSPPPGGDKRGHFIPKD